MWGRGDDQAEVARARGEHPAHRLAGEVGELVEAVEDDPDLGLTHEVRQRLEHLPGEEVQRFALRQGHAPLELGDSTGESWHGATELPLQVVGEAPLVSVIGENRDGVHEVVRDATAGDLGPSQRPCQARLARAGLARQHDDGTGPAGLDQLGQLGGRLEVPRVPQDLVASQAVLPEDVAGIVREIPPEREAGVVRVVGDVLRGAIPIPEKAVDVLTADSLWSLRISALEELDDGSGERRVGRGAVVSGGQQLEVDVSFQGLGPGFHRLPGPRPGVTGVEEHDQAAAVP